MNELMITNNELTMSSLEIAELTGKRHADVMRDIRNMLEEIHSAQKCAQYKDSTGRSLPMLLLNKEEALCLVAGYNVKMRMAIIKRWQELESQNALQLPNFNNPAEAARAWADQVEARIEAQKRVEELAPKAQFVDKYVQGDGLMKFRQVCKLLNAKENEFRAFLIDRKIMYRLNGTWVAHSNHLSIGRFESKTGVTAGGRAYSETLFTAKGVEWIAGEWAKYNVREVA